MTKSWIPACAPGGGVLSARGEKGRPPAAIGRQRRTCPPRGSRQNAWRGPLSGTTRESSRIL